MEACQNKNVLVVQRAEKFSPNSVDKDERILRAVCERLPFSEPKWVKEEQFPAFDEANLTVDIEIILSMARSPEVLQRLEKLRNRGVKVVNTGESVMRCERKNLETLMRKHSIAMPPEQGEHGYWIKRGDESAQSKDDVQYCADENALEKAKESFALRGVKNYTISAHVVGDVVKFYGVGEKFFRFYYPTDDGQTKYNDEIINGKAHHYPFNADKLHAEVVRLAALVGTNVYGGDAIIDSKGRFYIIDFNDWPSFSRCVDDAADAITREIMYLEN